MHWKTTVVLAILTAAGAGAWYWHHSRQPDGAPSTTQAFLVEQLTPDAIERLEVLRDGKSRFVLQRDAEGAWSLPGNWPVRAAEAREVVEALADQRSRFAAMPLEESTSLKGFGLESGYLTVKVKLKGQEKEAVLKLGEEPGERNRFSRPTYLQMEGTGEVVRLGPGVVAALDRDQEYFQQRRLFQAERVVKDEISKEKVERLLARAVRIRGAEKDHSFRLEKTGEEWILTDPVRDRTDPEKVKELLTAVPDLWVESFVDTKGKDAKAFGLEKPAYEIQVTRPSGEVMTLLVGEVWGTKKRKVALPAPPQQQPFQPPMPTFREIDEEYRYARLDDPRLGKTGSLGQVFLVKAENLKAIAPAYASLRDPELARFKVADVQSLRIREGEKELAFVRRDGAWKMEKPQAQDVEARPVEDLLEKLAGLEARDKDVLDQADPKTYGLADPAAVLEVVVREKAEADEKDKSDAKKASKKDGKKEAGKERTLVFRVGVKGKETDKIYVQVEGWPRVNAVDGKVLELSRRPAVAYRQRKVLDLAAADIGRLEVAQGKESFTLEQGKDLWQLAAPVQAKADAGKAEELAKELAGLEAIDFFAAPSKEDLEKVYGLEQPTLSVKIVPRDEKKKPRTLRVGKQRPDKQEWYARLDDGPVFALGKAVHDALTREALSYRPLDLWKTTGEEIAGFKIERDGNTYELRRDGTDWKIAAGFEAPAVGDLVRGLESDLEDLRALRWVAFDAKKPGEYGLEKPYLEVAVRFKDGKKTDMVLTIGSAAPAKEKEDPGRFARIQGQEGVFVLAAKKLAGLERSPLDFLDRTLAVLDTNRLEWLKVQGTIPFKLEKKKDKWEIVDSPAAPFAPEESALNATLRVWNFLRAEKVAAFGDKIDWKKYGLEKPAAVVTVHVAAGKDDKKAAKAVEHTLALGAETEKGGRYARLDQQNAVYVLDAKTVTGLDRTHLDFVDRKLLSFDFDAVKELVRTMPGADLTLEKRDEQWFLAKPESRPADDLTVRDLIEKTFRLRADRIAAYPAKDLAKFGLEKPAAVLTIKTLDPTGAPVDHVVKVGGPVLGKDGKPTGERYAQVDKSQAVAVLGKGLSRHLVGGVLHFADRSLAAFARADQAVARREARRAVFTRKDNAWRMTGPIETEAEDLALDGLVRNLLRLRADELVAEKPKDLKPYGLDEPEGEWIFRDGDRVVLHLLLGKADEGGRRYGKQAGKDVVFLLDKDLSKDLFAEYRQRKPWTGVDAAQIEKLTYLGPNAFSLKKTGASWTLVERPEAEVDDKKVTDTLDALASLKVLRWVADTKPNLQLYGLAPPVWTVELKTSGGTKTLQLGRMEGGSRRLYGHVPGTEGVFVLSEEDSRRILRSMGDFLVEAKEKAK